MTRCSDVTDAALPLPKSFVVEVTPRCQHRCLHCYNVWTGERAYPQGELPTEKLIDAIDRVIDATGATLVTLTGGEPLLRDDLPDIVAHLNARQVGVNLITNGGLLTEEKLAALTPGRVSIFELPLLSSRRAIHDELSGQAGAFDAATLAMARLKAKQQRVIGVFVATRLNLPTLRETLELAVALGLDGVMFNRFNPGGRGFANLARLQASPAELTEALRTANTLSGNYGLPVSCSIALPPCLIDMRPFTHLTTGFCAAGTERAYYTLDPMGNVRPCNHSPRIIGNVFTAPYAAIINGPANRTFCAALPEYCQPCARKDECRGCCIAAGESCHGSPDLLEPFVHEFIKQAIPIR